MTIDEFIVTSYTADKWTSNVTIQNSAYNWKEVYNLTIYNSTYLDLGDAFMVRVSPSYLRAGEWNNISIKSGYAGGNASAFCSTFNKALYRGRVPAAVNYSSILLSWSSILFSLRLRKLNLRRPFAIAVFWCFLLGFYKRRLKCLLRTPDKFLFTHNIVREQKLFFLENTCAVHFRPVCIYCEANSIIYKCANNCA